MKLAFDLDGVLRELSLYLNTKFNVPYPQEWFWKYEGKDIYDWIKQDSLMPLIYAPTTEYYWIAKYAFEKPEIWTNQPEEWKPKTKLWLDVHFPEYEVKYVDGKEKRKLLDDNPDTWLLEDSPLFNSYERILLIDRPYNQHIQDALRIKNLEDLDAWIWKTLKTGEVIHEGV
jgi:hypothetical protein